MSTTAPPRPIASQAASDGGWIVIHAPDADAPNGAIDEPYENFVADPRPKQDIFADPPFEEPGTLLDATQGASSRGDHAFEFVKPTSRPADTETELFGSLPHIGATNWPEAYEVLIEEFKRRLLEADEHERIPLLQAIYRGLKAPRTQNADSSFAATADELRNLLGPRLVAYLGGAPNVGEIDAWIEGDSLPNDDVRARLRVALVAARRLVETEGRTTAQAWFLGRNRHLQARAPARLLREEALESAAPSVLSAARAFSIGA